MKNIESFDSLEFLIETSLGFLNITGTELSLTRLDQEKCEVSIKGNIDAISYVSNKKNQKGKNTTTAIRLYEIEPQSYIVDTPGFSTFDLSEIESRDLEQYFIEFIEPRKDCEFIGCSHIKEQNCGVKKALEQGKISRGRYERYCKIYEELKEKEAHKW